MKLLIVDTFYGPYLQRLYADGTLAEQPWAQQHRAHFAGGFGTGDAYSHGLGLLGVPAIEIVANSAPLQQAWAREHRPELLQLSEQGGQLLFAILEAQIRWWQPTVLYVQDINWLPAAFLQHVKPLVQLVVGQNACPLAAGLNLSHYDLLVTAVPHYVQQFREYGVSAEYLPIGFDERLILRHDTKKPRSQPLSFVGGLGGFHNQGTQILELIAQEVPLHVWGYGGEALPPESTLRKRWRGEAWAEDMYELLADSQITLNRHIDIAKGYACNMRLYEATGMGACLVTDNKSNLSTLFEPDHEVVIYSTAGEAISKIRELIKNPSLASAIALRGQQRTIKDHTYAHHMNLLVDILGRFLNLRLDARALPRRGYVYSISYSKTIKLLVASTSRCFDLAIAWLDQMRQNKSNRFEVAFIIDKQIATSVSNVWMPICETDFERLAESCVNVFNPSVIVSFSDYSDLECQLINAIRTQCHTKGIPQKHHVLIC
jgi:spore maturation protein CgeB